MAATPEERVAAARLRGGSEPYGTAGADPLGGVRSKETDRPTKPGGPKGGGGMSVIDPAVSVRLSAADSRRLAGLLAEVADLLENPDPVRLTDDQADALGRGADVGRAELATWARSLAAELRTRLQHPA